MHATQGDADRAFHDFDRALKYTKELFGGYAATTVWDDYAQWALALGRLDVARACYEPALLVARERRILWRIPYLALRFAKILIVAGEYEDARSFLLDAMTYDTQTARLRVLKTTVAIDLALALKDAELLHRALDEEALELALHSSEPQCIAPIVAAFSKVAVERRQIPRVKKLIARGMAAMHHADDAGELLVLAARYGFRRDAEHAKSLLLERMQSPHHRVAQAYLAWWEAQAAIHQRATDTAEKHAEVAAQLFGRLGWSHQQTQALAQAGIQRRDEPKDVVAAFSHFKPALTKREQQIATLVLQGLKNRAIAELLSISEHTVESHVTSILNRLGLRSRWQLTEAVS